MSDLDRIFDKLDAIDGRLDTTNETLARQGAVLEEHVRRTDLLEAKIEKHEEKVAVELEERYERVDAEIRPIKEHVALVGAVAKIVAALGALTALAVGIKELFWGL